MTTTTAGTAGDTAAGGDCTLDTPLKIGYAADFSDFGGFADVPGSEAAGVQVDLLNEAGGVGGQPVEYVIKELPGDPSGAQRVAQELLDEGVDAIIAPPFAYNGVPLIDTVDGQVPIISNASTDLALADPARGRVPDELQRPGAGGGRCRVRRRRRGDDGGDVLLARRPVLHEHHLGVHRGLRRSRRRGRPRLHVRHRRRGLLRRRSTSWRSSIRRPTCSTRR